MTHLGPSQNCGHYTAIGQAPNSNYYQFDDSCVRPLPLSAVLGTNAYIMFFEKDNTIEDSMAPSASTSNVVYGPQLSDNILNSEKNPLKLTFYRSDDKKSIALNSITSTEGPKPDTKPIILNSTLSKSLESSNSISEPWVVKQNGEVEKVMTGPKIQNGGENSSHKTDEDKKISFIIKKQGDECNINKPKISKSDSDIRSSVNIATKPLEKSASMSKLVKPLKSPLEKLEEQMNKSNSSPVHRNGDSTSRLVPYDSESSSDERCDDRARKEELKEQSRKKKPSRCDSPQGLIVTTKAMHHAWTVSKEKNAPLLSPSLNGDTNKK